MSRTYIRACALIIAASLGLTGCTADGSSTDDSSAAATESTESIVTLCNTETGRFAYAREDRVSERMAENDKLTRSMEVCEERLAQWEQAEEARAKRALNRDLFTLRQAVDAAVTRADKMLAVLNHACRRSYAVSLDWPEKTQVYESTEYLAAYSKVYRKYWYPSRDAAFTYDLTSSMIKQCPRQFYPVDYSAGGG